MPQVITVDQLLKARKLSRRRKFQGLDISVETQRGAYRHWHDPHTGRDGKTRMPWDYGYIRGSVGADGDHVDAYIGPDPNATHAYVIDQMKAPDFQIFDEQKVFLGFESAQDARAAYATCYDKPGFFGRLKAVPMGEFRKQVLATTADSPLIKAGGDTEMIHEIFEDATPGYPVVTHTFRGTDRAMVQGLFRAHMKTDEFMRDMEKAGEWNGVKGRTVKRWSTAGMGLRKGAPFIGPRGGKWADAKHAVPWTAQHEKRGGARTGVVPIDEKKIAETVDMLFDMGYSPPNADGVRMLRPGTPTALKVRGDLEVVLGSSRGTRGSLHQTRSGAGVIHMRAKQYIFVNGERDEKAALRRTLAHEWTHFNDPENTIRVKRAAEAAEAAEAGKAESQKPPSKTFDAHQAYQNQPVEVTAKMQEIHRDLRHPFPARYARRGLSGTALISWASEHSAAFREAFPIFNAANQKRVLRMIADTATGLKDKTLETQQKSDQEIPTLRKAKSDPRLGIRLQPVTV